MTVSESRDSTTVIVEVSGVDPVFVFGPEDRLLRVIEESFPDLKFLARGNQVEISGLGSEVAKAETRISRLRGNRLSVR